MPRPLLPDAAGVFATHADNPRAASTAEIVATVTALGYEAWGYETVCAALQAALALAAPEDLVVTTGSLFVVGDLLNCWENLKSVSVESAVGAGHAPREED